MAIAAASLFFVYHLLKYFVIFSAAYIVLRWCSSDKNKLPPGPTTWPIVGNLMQFDLENPLVTFYQWAKQFGPVYRLYMGSELNIVINDHEVLRTVFSGHYGEITAGISIHRMLHRPIHKRSVGGKS